jgi:hypothetical protein
VKRVPFGFIELIAHDKQPTPHHLTKGTLSWWCRKLVKPLRSICSHELALIENKVISQCKIIISESDLGSSSRIRRRSKSFLHH